MTTKRLLFLSLVFSLLITNPLIPSNESIKRIDSLRSELPKSLEDTNKVNLLCSLSKYFYNIKSRFRNKIRDFVGKISTEAGMEKRISKII
jgi:hypothetical protein